jgi:tRNA(Glu) U13 pseudouridine synthase TruD
MKCVREAIVFFIAVTLLVESDHSRSSTFSITGKVYSDGCTNVRSDCDDPDPITTDQLPDSLKNDDADSELNLPTYDEHSVWIRCFRNSPRKGIGGVLTHWWRPSDFEVIELRAEDGRKVTSSKTLTYEHDARDISLPSRFIKFLLQKQGWDTLSALSAITKCLVARGEHIDVSHFG